MEDHVKAINPLNAELNPICYLLALLGAHHFLQVSRIRVNKIQSNIFIFILMSVTLILILLSE